MWNPHFGGFGLVLRRIRASRQSLSPGAGGDLGYGAKIRQKGPAITYDSRRDRHNPDCEDFGVLGGIFGTIPAPYCVPRQHHGHP